MIKNDNGVWLFCEWIENGTYHNGYKFFTNEEYRRMVEEETAK